MSARTTQRSMLAALALFIGACASAPEHLYTLDAVEHVPVADRSNLPLVLVGPVTVPEIVDRPQLVVREGKYAVVLKEQERWATPLKESLPMVVAAQLDERCPGARFRPLSNTVAEEPGAWLAIEFTNIEISRATGVSVAAAWAYRDASKRGVEGDGEGHADLDSTNFPSYVDGLQRALSAWTNFVVKQLPVCQ